MTDFAKKVEKERARLLAADEQVLGVSMVQPKGAMKKQAIAGGIGGVVGIVAANKLAGDKGPGPSGLAASMPAKRCVAVLTDRRLMIVALGSMMNSLKDVEAQWPREQVSQIAMINQGKLVSQIGIAFVDGSTAEVESVRAGQPRALVDAFVPAGQPAGF